MAASQFLKLALFASVILSALSLSQALNVGVQFTYNAHSMNKTCSKTCESDFCTVPPFLKYGKYCGVLYTGCPGEAPCDGLDACCQKHDACVEGKNNDYLSQECSQDFLTCIAAFKSSGEKTFEGNKCYVKGLVDILTGIMESALVAGRFLHLP